MEPNSDTWELTDLEPDHVSRPSSPSHFEADSTLLKPGTFEQPDDDTVHNSRHPGFPLRRYYRRGLVGCFAPFIITLYFLLIWALYLNPHQSPDGTIFGRSGAQLVFYSWFIIGVFGLDIGEYGMVGVEASMLMNSFWAVPNASHIMMYGDHTWSGIGGWINALKTLILRRWRSELPTKLWTVLAAVTLFLFTGLPLTGLTMELNNGYVASRSLPDVAGQRWETFNQRDSPATSAAIYYAWSLAVPPRVPGRGVIYTNISADRTNPALNKLNAVPTDAGVDNLFLTPQANTPVSGRFWGLMIRYNCSIVENIEDFSILSRRNSSKPLSPTGDSSYQVGPQTEIHVFNRTRLDMSFNNYKVVAEFGYSTEGYGSYSAGQFPYQCYFNSSSNATIGYPGLEHDSILELALWQHGSNSSPLADPPLPSSFFNLSLDVPVSGLGGAYSVPSDDYRLSNATIPMAAIGVQCKSSSALGFADVDGMTSTYENFERSDTPIINLTSACPHRLSLTLPEILFKTPIDRERDLWAENFFTSAETMPTLRTALADDAVVWLTVRPTLLQASDLRRSLLRAFGTTAVQLMYDGGQGYSFEEIGQRFRFTNPNATAFQPIRVLTTGLVPPVIPAILMGLWCLGSCYLSFKYGFKRRWSETLDSFSMFRFGADFGDKVKDNPAFGRAEAEECEELKALPGLIGDSRPSFQPGHVSLVASAEARKGKRYM
ncbi:hypothetical protein BKA65DRAFT_3394 [Rhexocercosporidium sp. MPI-PUGE-AT-0058]|nr:hypothetical protein BKA65DRAFT_3394 [Rhexocercosporidium sp. MPI-PUGE-AT-0058]